MKTVRIILAVELAVFLIGLSIGVTGSSLGYNRAFDPNLKIDEEKILGSYRPVRIDEWAIGTLLSIAQYNTKTQFPVLNENLGVTGKKLAVAHDTGVPVKDLSLLGKPATWGFFLFDLRRALSWYWLFPVFIGINGVWFLLNMIWQKQPGVNFCFSLYLAFSYHSVAWSFWPAWQIGLACLSTALFLFILKNQSPKLIFLASVSLGVFLASTALTLYYPRLVPVITCLLLLVGAVCIKEKLFKNIYEKKWYLLLAVSITIVVLYGWYVSNSDAISSVLSSTHPGQRRNYGGSFSLFREFSGWLDPIWVFTTFGYHNSSEMAMYYSFIFAIIPILLFSRVRKDIIIYTLMIYMLFNYYYLCIGLPHWLGKLSFWNRTTYLRAIIGIELCQVFIFSWLYSKKDEIINNKYTLWCSVLLPIAISLILAHSMPSKVMEQLLNLKMMIILAVCFILLSTAYFVLMNKIKFFPYVLLAVTLPVTFFWNPLCISPSYFKVELPYEITKNSDQKYGGRILTATGGHPDLIRANILAAAGHRVLNATSHYVDRDIYENFYKEIDNKGSFKKFNHMVINLDGKNKNELVSWLNLIIFNLNYDYDFSKFKADYVVTRTPPALLEANKSLEFLVEKGGFFWYKILHA